MDDALANLEAISESVDELDVGVSQVATATDQQAAGAEEIATMVDRTAENAAGILDEARAIDDAVRGQTTAIRDASGRVDPIGDAVDDGRAAGR